jgi:Phage capsid family
MAKPLSAGRSREYWELVELERDLGEQLAAWNLHNTAIRDLRRAADGSVYRRLVSDVLEPARLERATPMSSFAAACTPDPSRLRGRDWLKEIYHCPADVITLSGRLEASARLFQRAGDELQILAALLGVEARATRYFRSAYKPALAAVDSQTTGEGKEFVPIGLSGRALERIGAGLVVASLFETIVMTSSPYRLPGFAVRPGRPYLHREQTADTGQAAIGFVTPGTRQVDLVASKIAVTAIISSEAAEDMLTPLVDAIERELSDWLAAGVDDAIVNGDTAATHMDADVTASNDPRKSWAGLRKLAPAAAKTDGGNAALTAAMLRANRKRLGRNGAIGSQLVHLVGNAGAAQITADPAVVTPDRYGGQVVLLPGEVGHLDGVPIVASDFIREDLNASGVYDGTTVNRSIALTANRNGFVIGQRRAITVAASDELLREFDQRAILSTLRLAFASSQPAGQEPCALTYNLAIT